jgi:nicotinate-nucleotide adenylyltransferase
MKNIGLIGGTFDPIHFGHLILAEQAKEEACLEQVIFMPAKVSPYKVNSRCVSEDHRFNMVSLAIADNDRFSVSDLEICGPRISYTIDTLEAMQLEFGSNYRINFICGTDAFIGMYGWKNKDSLLRKFPLIVGSRPGYRDRARDEMIKKVSSEYGATVQKVHMPKIEISSTDIKQRIKDGRSILYMMPKAVIEYIGSHGLYRNL